VAIKWYRLAAAQGHAQARKYLEQMGEKVPDTKKEKPAKRKRVTSVDNV
jgi:TPR repeat protein